MGSKQRDSNEEVVQCSGDTKSYININSGQPFEALSPCIRRSDDNECKVSLYIHGIFPAVVSSEYSIE